MIRILHESTKGTTGGQVFWLAMSNFYSLVAVALAVACTGCTHYRQATWKLTTPEEMKAVTLQHVPPGTTLSDARKFMESEGFDCEVKRGEEFSERRARYDAGEKHPNLDYLQCLRSNEGGFITSRYWDIALVLDKERVTDVLVGHYIDGPLVFEKR